MGDSADGALLHDEWKKVGDLEDGDHVSVIKYVVFLGGRRLSYWHHGIFSAQFDAVVAFTVEIKERPETESGQESYKPMFRKILLDTSSHFLVKAQDGHIAVQRKTFFQCREGRYKGLIKVHRYGARSAGGALPTCSNAPNPYATEEIDRANAVAVAEFFTPTEEHNFAFGQYHFRKWNCECFATFCCTTRLTPADLAKMFDEMEGSCIAEADLRAVATVRSVQSDTFVLGGKFCEKLPEGEPAQDLTSAELHVFDWTNPPEDFNAV